MLEGYYAELNRYETEILPVLAAKRKIVLTANSSFFYGNISVTGPLPPDVLTDKLFLKNMFIAGHVNYCYSPRIDFDHYCYPHPRVPNVWIATVERAFVECIQSNFDYILQDYFCDSMERYQRFGDINYDLFCEVAEFYGMKKSVVDYWLAETADYNAH